MTVTELGHRTARPPAAARATRLDAFCDELFDSLPRSDQRRWARTYLEGLVSVPGRKSIRRISEQVASGEADQCLQQFLNQSPWDWGPVRRALARLVTETERPRAWVVDQAVLPKNGDQSVGVARQFVPSAGRVLNCQMALTLSLAGGSGGVPVDWQLLLPRSWDDDERRRVRTGLPDSETHRHQWAHLLLMVDEMVRGWGMRPLPLLVDASWSPRVAALLRSLEDRRLRYVVRVPADTTIATADDAVRVAALANPVTGLGVVSHETTDPDRPGGVTYACGRLPERPGGSQGVARPAGRVVTRWRPRAAEPDAVYLTNLSGMRLPQITDLVRLGERTRDGHARLHSESGLGHFEGRSFRGWHHHVTLVSAAHAYRLRAEQRQALIG